MLINNAVITGSLTVNGTDVTYITGSSQISSSFLALSSSYLITSASYVVTSGSYAITSASFAQTSGSLSIRTGNLEATSSTLTSASSSFAAQSASLSTRLTTDETNITTLTNASASFAVVSSSFSSTSGSLSTRVTNLEATSSTVSSSFASTSGSIAGRVTTIESKYATTGSNTFTNLQYISSTTNAAGFTTSASLYTDGGARITKDLFVSGTTYLTNLTVYGTASVQYITSSQINVGANIIYLNTQTPAVRYGGMAVADSGSNAGVTGSMLWDSVNNGWIYTRESGSTYSGGALISGPRSSVQGSEQGTLNNYITKGQGGDHITSSQIIDDGTTVQIPGNLQVTGSIVGSSTVTATNGQFGGYGSTAASITAYSKTLGSYTAAIRMIENSAASTYWDMGVTGGASPVLNFYSNGSAALVSIASSGNLGLGVTPSAWSTPTLSTKAIQVGSVTSLFDIGVTYGTFLGYNYYNGESVGDRYLQTGYASLYQQKTGQHIWYNAPSGTAGAAITFTQAMTLDASGNLLVGTTTVQNSASGRGNITIGGTSSSIINFSHNNADNGYIFHNGDLNIVNRTSTGPIIFGAGSGSERMRIYGATGNVFIGSSPSDSGYKLDVNGTGRFSSSVSVNGNNLTIQPTTTTTYALSVMQNAGGYLRVGRDTSTGALYGDAYAGLVVSSGAYPLIFGTNDTERLRIASTGAATFSSSITSLINTAGIQNQLILENLNTTEGADGNSIYFKGYQGSLAKISAYGIPTQQVGGYLQLQSYSDNTTANTGLIITQGGNVGIGTTSPTNKLTIQSNSTQLRLETASDPSGYYSFLESNYDASNPFNLYTSAAASYILGAKSLVGIDTYLNSYYNLAFMTGGSSPSLGNIRMFIANSGNVGIGTTSPKTILQITNGNFSAYNNTASSGGAQIYLGDTNFDNGSYYNSAPGIGAAYNSGQGVAGDLAFYNYASAAGSRYEGMRLSGGKLGIGTTSPNAKLEVIGSTSNINGYADGSIQVTGLSPIAFVGPSNLNPSLNRWGFKLRNANEGDFTIYDYTNSATRVLINSTGNVGIGTTNIGTESNLSLGANGATEGGQLVLQKGTSRTYASHIDNYADKFRIMSGTDTTSSAEKFSVDMSNGTITTYGTILTMKSTGGGQYQQTVVGQIAAGSSGVAKKIAYVGHTHSIRVYLYIVQDTANVATGIADFTTAYGSSSGGLTQSSRIGNISSISAAYNNGGSPAYTIDVTVNYTGAAPTINYTIEGLNNDNSIYTL